MRLVYRSLLVVIVLAALFIGFWHYEDKRISVTNAPVPLLLEFQGYATHPLSIRGKQYQVFVADTQALREHGLSGKSGLPPGFGMEFVFERPGVYGFWMKDMRFPLDIIWVRNNVVVDVWENASVPTGGSIPSYSPSGTAERVYEFNAGFVQQNKLGIGKAI